MILATLLVFTLQGPATWAANILVMVPIPSKSHSILMERLLLGLDDRGHNLTYISAFLPSKNLTNGRILHIPELLQVMIDTVTTGKNQNFLMELKEKSAWKHQLDMPDIGYNLCEALLARDVIQNLIQSEETFDLILGTVMLDESVLAGFSARFKAPLVLLQTMSPGIWANYMTGNPSPPAYVPDPFLGYSARMNLWERFHNLIFTKLLEIYYSSIVLPKQDGIMRKYFSEDLPPIEKVLKNTSLVLVNHHHSLGVSRPYLANMVEVAGLHISPPKPLPEDLKSLMDNSVNGVVMFSLGTNAPSSQMPADKIQSFLKAFSRLKQNVLWKFETNLDNFPRNVKIMKWLPQSDLLAHPNMRLFITHGGLLSTTEAIERGVPVVGIPLFGDQPLNMRHTENAGLGKMIYFDDITEDLVFETVSEVLNNPRFKEQAASSSKLLKDNPMSALERAIWWVEYILRHKGAPHLRSAVQDLNWYQVHLIDVILFGAFLLILGVWAVINLGKSLIGSMGKPQKKKKH